MPQLVGEDGPKSLGFDQASAEDQSPAADDGVWKWVVQDVDADVLQLPGPAIANERQRIIDRFLFARRGSPGTRRTSPQSALARPEKGQDRPEQRPGSCSDGNGAWVRRREQKTPSDDHPEVDEYAAQEGHGELDQKTRQVERETRKMRGQANRDTRIG